MHILDGNNNICICPFFLVLFPIKPNREYLTIPQKMISTLIFHIVIFVMIVG